MFLKSSTTWVCAVAVGTVWTSPQSPRDIDAESLKNPVRMPKWLADLRNEERLNLVDGDRIQTQILYGEPVFIDSIEGEWARVICPWQKSKKDERGYPGWMPIHQLIEVERASHFGYAKVKVDKAQLWSVDKEPLFIVPFNTMLPVVEAGELFTTVQTPHGEALLWNLDIETATSVETFLKNDGYEVVATASKFLDLPYLWGGMSSYGYDCSGFTYNVLKANGYWIARDARDQATWGIEVDIHDSEEWQLGDLLFFARENESIHHVGLYYGNGYMIHASATGETIEIRKLADSKYAEQLCQVRRVI